MKIIAKIKSKLAAALTGKFLPGILTTATMVAGAKVLEFYAKAEERFPDIREIIQPETLQDATGEIVTGIILLAVARMLGKPVRELQEQADEIGLEPGAKDGLIGPVFKEAHRKMVNDPSVRVEKGRLVRNQGNPAPKKPHRFFREKI